MDNIDKKLVSILMDDGRTSLSEIGKHVVDGGMSHVAVSKRLEKLVSDENGQKPLVKISAGVNLEQLDMKVLFLGLETENMEVTDRIVKKYSSCPRLLMLAPVTGRYNLFAVMVAEDTFSLESILGTCSLRTEQGIRRSETWFGNSPAYPEYAPIDLSPEKRSKAVCHQSCNDCRRFMSNKCVGCPTVEGYNGSVFSTNDSEHKQRGKGASSKS